MHPANNSDLDNIQKRSRATMNNLFKLKNDIKLIDISEERDISGKEYYLENIDEFVILTTKNNIKLNASVIIYLPSIGYKVGSEITIINLSKNGFPIFFPSIFLSCV